MSFFEFPHTRTYDTDLGWIIKHLGELLQDTAALQAWAGEHKEQYKELADKVDGLINNLVDVIVPWDSSIAYHIFSIVEYQGTNYIAVQDVPVGAMITNTDYWQPANTVVEQINAIGVIVSDLQDHNKYFMIVNLDTDNLQEAINTAPEGANIYCYNTDTTNKVYQINGKNITITGGNFEKPARPCSYTDYGISPFYMLTNGADVTIARGHYKATSYGENPFIYMRGGIDPDGATDSNVELASVVNSTIHVIDCHLINMCGVFGNNAKMHINGCYAITSMFAFGSEVECISENNQIEVQNSGLKSFYHVYYLDTNSTLKAANDSINSPGIFFDVVHSGTEESKAGLEATLTGVTAVGLFRRFSQGINLSVRAHGCYFNLPEEEVIDGGPLYGYGSFNFNLLTQRSLDWSRYKWNEGKAIGSTGGIYADANRRITDLIPVDFKYYRQVRYPQDGYIDGGLIAFYDTNNSFLGRSSGSQLSTVPDGTANMRIQTPINTNIQWQIW